MPLFIHLVRYRFGHSHNEIGLFLSAMQIIKKIPWVVPNRHFFPNLIADVNQRIDFWQITILAQYNRPSRLRLDYFLEISGKWSGMTFCDFLFLAHSHPDAPSLSVGYLSQFWLSDTQLVMVFYLIIFFTVW